MKTLVASIDPAHNLGDAFAIRLGDRITHVGDNLDAVEVNIEDMIRAYLDELSVKMKHTYSYMSAMNIDGYFDILKNSPGIEEYATMEAIKKFIALTEYDAVVFDTPPTGMTIRVLAMPRVAAVDRTADQDAEEDPCDAGNGGECPGEIRGRSRRREGRALLKREGRPHHAGAGQLPGGTAGLEGHVFI